MSQILEFWSNYELKTEKVSTFVCRRGRPLIQVNVPLPCIVTSLFLAYLWLQQYVLVIHHSRQPYRERQRQEREEKGGRDHDLGCAHIQTFLILSSWNPFRSSICILVFSWDFSNMLPLGALRILIEEKFGTFPYFLIYALVEWVVIILLLLDGFLTFVSNEIARLFELKTPCLLCTQLDHVLVQRDSNFYYNDSICEVHKMDLSTLAYCHLHKRLSDIRTMCQGCLLAFVTDKDSVSDKHNSAVTPLVEDERKSHLKPLKKEEMEIVADMCRCSCCGKPMKSKSSSKYNKSLSICSPAHSPRAPWFSVRDDEGGSMDLPPKLIADTDLEEAFLDDHGEFLAEFIVV